MSSKIFKPVAGYLLLVAGVCNSAYADGGVVRAMKEVGPYRVTVFTSPNPLRTGPIDISVLLQDPKSGEARYDGPILVTVTSRDGNGEAIYATATTAAATNKLLQAAQFDLPAPGWWDVEVTGAIVNEKFKVAFPVEAEPSLPNWLVIWPWFTWPCGAVLLFAVHRLIKQKSRR